VSSTLSPDGTGRVLDIADSPPRDETEEDIAENTRGATTATSDIFLVHLANNPRSTTRPPGNNKSPRASLKDADPPPECFAPGERVEYWSETYNTFLPGTMVSLNAKVNTLSLRLLGKQLRNNVRWDQIRLPLRKGEECDFYMDETVKWTDMNATISERMRGASGYKLTARRRIFRVEANEVRRKFAVGQKVLVLLYRKWQEGVVKEVADEFRGDHRKRKVELKQGGSSGAYFLSVPGGGGEAEGAPASGTAGGPRRNSWMSGAARHHKNFLKKQGRSSGQMNREETEFRLFDEDDLSLPLGLHFTKKWEVSRVDIGTQADLLHVQAGWTMVMFGGEPVKAVDRFAEFRGEKGFDLRAALGEMRRKLQRTVMIEWQTSSPGENEGGYSSSASSASSSKASTRTGSKESADGTAANRKAFLPLEDAKAKNDETEGAPQGGGRAFKQEAAATPRSAQLTPRPPSKMPTRGKFLAVSRWMSGAAKKKEDTGPEQASSKVNARKGSREIVAEQTPNVSPARKSASALSVPEDDDEEIEKPRPDLLEGMFGERILVTLSSSTADRGTDSSETLWVNPREVQILPVAIAETKARDFMSVKHNALLALPDFHGGLDMIVPRPTTSGTRTSKRKSKEERKVSMMLPTTPQRNTERGAEDQDEQKRISPSSSAGAPSPRPLALTVGGDTSPDVKDNESSDSPSHPSSDGDGSFDADHDAERKLEVLDTEDIDIQVDTLALEDGPGGDNGDDDEEQEEFEV